MLRQESQIKQVPIEIVGGNTFERYSKQSISATWNMIQSGTGVGKGLVDFSGYANVLGLQSGAQGRALYTSNITNNMYAVAGNGFYSIDDGITKTLLGNLATSSGNVWIAENNGSQIAITDEFNMYVWNYAANTFTTTSTATLGFTPGYITFQNGRFICAAIDSQTWRLSNFNNGDGSANWPADSQHVGAFQTKPDFVQGVVRFPSRGNLLLVMGNIVTEFWTDAGNALFPYVKSSTQNIDYGCLNPATIVSNEEMVIWLAGNEQSGPVIMYTTGGDFHRVSTDGIDFKLSQLTTPTDSYGSLFRQDGHLIYLLTFPTDNLSYIYDFNTDKFFSVSDENLNYFIARKVVYFNDKYYFVSFNDGNLYEFGTQFTNYQYSSSNIKEIPRIRIPPPVRLPSQRYYIGNNLQFTIENGQPNTITSTNVNIQGNEILLAAENGNIITAENGNQIASDQYYQVTPDVISNMRVDLSVTRDGGETFGNIVSNNMNPTGQRKSRMIFYRLGIANDSSYQLRFWGFSRFVVFDGLVELYQ